MLVRGIVVRIARFKGGFSLIDVALLCFVIMIDIG